MLSSALGGWTRGSRHCFSVAAAALAAGVLLFGAAREVRAQIALPPPDLEADAVGFDLLPDGRLLAFTGQQLHVQKTRGSSQFRAIGTLPDEFRERIAAGSVRLHPSGRFFLVDTTYQGDAGAPTRTSGVLFALPRSGGQAKAIWSIPERDYVVGLYGGAGVLVRRSLGDLNSFEYLSLKSRQLSPLIAPVPGKRMAGIAADRAGNLFAATHYDLEAQQYVGEIRKFTRAQVQRTLRSGVALDFYADGEHIDSVLTVSELFFDRQGHLWVYGGEPSEGTDGGVLAEVDLRTGAVLRRFTEYGSGTTGTPPSCRLVALGTQGTWNSPLVYELDACADYGSAARAGQRVAPRGYTWSD
jgi:hypothetical protein